MTDAPDRWPRGRIDYVQRLTKDVAVECRQATGFSMSLAQLFGSGPKWTIACGACPATFKARLPMIEDPTVRCPYCGTWNVVPVAVKLGDR